MSDDPFSRRGRIYRPTRRRRIIRSIVRNVASVAVLAALVALIAGGAYLFATLAN